MLQSNDIKNILLYILIIKMSKVDYLTEDTFLPSSQQFVCLSFLTDKENKTTLSGIKIRGVFASYDEACEHAKKVQSIDPYFNVFVGEMGKWLPFDPNPDSEAVKDSEYANTQLNQMMKSYMQNQEKAKIYQEQRKTEMVRKNIMDNLTTRNENLEEVQTKLSKAKTSDERSSLEQSVKSIEDQIKKMEEKKADLDKQLDSITTQIKEFDTNEVVGPKIIDNSLEL
jgi:hypothetical protein